MPHHSHEREKVPRILVSHIWYANTHSIWHIPNTQEQVSSKQGKVLVIRVSSFVAPQAAKGENYMVWENRGSLSTETQNTHSTSAEMLTSNYMPGLHYRIAMRHNKTKASQSTEGRGWCAARQQTIPGSNKVNSGEAENI